MLLYVLVWGKLWKKGGTTIFLNFYRKEIKKLRNKGIKERELGL